MVSALRQRFDESGEFLSSVAVVAGELDQLPSPRDDGADFRRTGHGDAASATKLQQALIAQHPKGSKDGVGVDVEDRRQVSGRWQSFAAPGLTVGDGASKFGGDLIMQRDRFFGGQLDTQHGAR
jgi:hypothetical protein